MACTPQELVNANPCFACLTEAQGDWTLTMLLCVVAGGAAPPPTDEYVIGGEDGNTIIGPEGGGMLGVE